MTSHKDTGFSAESYKINLMTFPTDDFAYVVRCPHGEEVAKCKTHNAARRVVQALVMLDAMSRTLRATEDMSDA